MKNIIQPANTRNTEIQDKNKTIDKMQLIAAILAAVHLLTALPVTTGLLIRSHWSHVRMSTLPPARVDGRRGGEVVLLCSASGSPAPSVAWYKDDLFVSHSDWSVDQGGNSIGETVARLVLPCLTDSDAGVYECRAKAGQHEATATTQLNIVPDDAATGAAADSDDNQQQPRCTVPNRPVIAVWRPMYLVEEGDTARLPCTVQSGVPAGQVSWTNALGAQAADNNDSRIQVEESGDLVITNINFKDMGQYTCTVTGTEGSDSVHSFVYPLAPSRNSLN